MDYTLSTTNVTDVSFDIVITANVATTGIRTLALKVEDASAPGTGTNFMLTDTGMAQGATETFSVGGSEGAGMVINTNTEYNISLKVNNVDVADPITVTTKAAGYDTPRTATQEQWEDLADRIKAKANSSDVPTITMTSTDPGEGSPLPANNYIAVYSSMGSLLDMFYPVGCYFETSDTSFDPNVTWGGTWIEDTSGRVTVSQNSGTFATVGDTGGSETYSHYHWQSGGTDTGSYYDLTDQAVTSEGLQSRIVTKDRVIFGNGGRATNAMRQTTTYSANTSSVQPYIVVKRWHRTA